MIHGSIDWLYKMREASYAKRYHTRHVHGENNVGFHAFSVANLVMHLTEGQASRELILAALWHDQAEINTGDIPAPVKWANPDLNRIIKKIEWDFDRKWGIHVQLSDDEKLVLKWADMLDFMLYVYEQRLLGNRIQDDNFWLTYDYMWQILPHHPKGRELLEEVVTKFRSLK